MASADFSNSSVSEETKPTDSMDAHIREIRKMFDFALKAKGLLAEAKARNELKGGKLTLPDGEELTNSKLHDMVSKVKRELDRIPRMIREKQKAEKLARKARHGPPRKQSPSQFSKPLVDFFNAIDLGNGPNGKRLQDHPDMALFFKNGVGMLTFGVSLFNVWGNIQKIKTGTNKVIVGDRERHHISAALDALRKKKVEEGKTDDLASLDAGELKNKDYMSILSFYRVKDSSADLERFTEPVTKMSELTKTLNTQYGQQLHPKVEKERKKPTTPLRKSAPPAATTKAASPSKTAAKTAAAAPAPAPVASSAKGTSPRKAKR